MTEAEELEYLRLKQKRARSAPSRAEQDALTHNTSGMAGPNGVDDGRPKVPISAAEAFGLGAAQGGSFSLGDEAGGVVQAIGDKASGDKRDWGDLYRYNRDAFRRADANAQASKPGAFLGGTLAGTLITAPAIPGGGGATLGGQVVRGALQGAGVGALNGLGASSGELTTSDGRTEAAWDTAKGGLGGLVVGGLVPIGVAGAKGAVRGLVQPTEAAAALRAKGVPLTIGQLNPNTPFAQLEEAGTSVGGIGPSIKGQRDAAKSAWQQLVLDSARAPGAPEVPAGGSAGDRLRRAYEGFEQAYAPAKAAEILPQTAEGIPLRAAGPASRILGAEGQPARAPVATFSPWESAIDDPSALATAEDKAVVQRFLDNQLTLVNQPDASGNFSQPVPAQTILQMRSNIREAARDALKRQDFAKAQLLGNAEATVTRSLEAQLPEDALKALRAADAQYSQYKTVEGAVARGGDSPDEFTPSHLSAQIRSDTEKGNYARGAGGPLRELASQGKEVLDARIPMTGVRALAAGPFQWATAPMSYVANLPFPKRVLTGNTSLQQAAQRVVDAPGLAEILRFLDTKPSVPSASAMSRALLQPIPISAEIEDPRKKKAR